MAAYVSNIVIDVGADFYQLFNLEDNSGNYLNLSGYSGSSVMKKHPSSLYASATFSVTFPNVSLGKLQIGLASSITSTLKPGRYVYDILIDDGSTKTRVVEGSAIVTAGVTVG